MRWYEWAARRERNEAIVDGFMQGRTMAALAKTYGLTEARVCQIIASYGVARTEGGASLRARSTEKLKSPSA